MDKRSLKSIVIFVLLFMYVLIYKPIIFTSLKEYCEAISSSIIIILFALSYFFFGFSKTKHNSFKKNVSWIVYGSVIVFFSLSYLYGLFAGFLKNPYSLSLFNIINNSFFIILIIIFSELLRYNVIRANKDKKWVIYLCTILLILFDIVISVKKLQFDTFAYGFKIVTSIIFPIIAKNIVLSYLYYYIDFKSGLFYRILMETYIYIVPIIPKTSDYINSIVGIMLPIIIYIYASRMIDEYENGVEKIFVKNTFNWFDVPIITVSLILICLISRAFPYYIISIGSESMTGSIYRGDSVILYKENNVDKIKVGDVIAYKKSGKIIVHRLIKIEKEKENTYYITKGDANTSKDDVLLTMDDIEGVVKLNIRYIGYPSIWMSNLMN